MFEALLPPPEYDRPFDGKLVIEYVMPSDVNRRCQHPSLRGRIIQACAIPDPNNNICTIIFPIDTGVYPKRYLEHTMRHEIGHCNGWRHK